MIHLSVIARKALEDLEKDSLSKLAANYLEILRNSKPPYFVTDLNGVTQHVTAEDFSKEFAKIIYTKNKSLYRLSKHVPKRYLKKLNEFLTYKNYYDKIHLLRWKIGDPIWKLMGKKDKNGDEDEFINEFVLKKIMFELFHSPYKQNRVFYPERKSYEAFRRGDIKPEQHIENVLIHFGFNSVEAGNLAPELFKYYAHEMLDVDKIFMNIIYKLQDNGHLAGVVTDRLPLAMSAAMAKNNYLDKLYLPIVSSHTVTEQQKQLIEKPHKIMFETFLEETESLFRLAGKLKGGEKINPYDFVFIDDREENIEGSKDAKKRARGYTGAKSVGMRGILYEGYKKGLEKFIEDLKNLEEFRKNPNDLDL